VSVGGGYNVHVLERLVGRAVRSEQTAVDCHVPALHPATHHVTLQTLPLPSFAGPLSRIFSARQYAERAICYRKSVCPSVRHTGGSVETG